MVVTPKNKNKKTLSTNRRNAGTKSRTKNAHDNVTHMEIRVASMISQNLSEYLRHLGESHLSFFGSDFADLDARDMSGDSILHIAVRGNEVEIVRELVSLGVNLDFQDSMGNSPIFSAISEKSFAMVEILVTGGAKLDLHNETNYTPLQYAEEVIPSEEIASFLRKSLVERASAKKKGG
jgi:hypothetical protein